MALAFSISSATTSARSCCSIARSLLASIFSTEQRAGSCGRAEVLDRLEQHFEQHGGRPAEHQDTVHRGHRADEPPCFHRRDIAIAERWLIYQGEIQEIAAFRCGA